MIDTDYKKIANDYFEGRIAPADEAVLCDFLRTPANRVQFHAWESEWMTHRMPNVHTERAWNRFKLEQKARLFAERRTTQHSHRLWYAAAAVVLLLMVTALGVWNFAARSGNDVPCYVVEAARGEKSKVLLADGSVVFLNAKSQLIYGSGFNEDNRHVRLVGEGYFEVAKNTDLPFVVEVGDGQITTSLFEGSVLVACADSIVRLQPNEALKLTCATHTLELQSTDDSPMKWVKNQLIYNDITVGDLFRRLGRQYNMTLVTDAPALENDTMRIALRNHENFEDVLFALEQVLPIATRLSNDTVFITER